MPPVTRRAGILVQNTKAPRGHGQPGSRRFRQKTRQQWTAFAEKTAKTMQKAMRSSFLAPFRERENHRSVGHRKTCGRGRFKTLNRGTDTWDVSLCVVRVYSENAASELASGENRARGSRDLAGAFSATMVCIRGASRAVLRTTGSSNAWSASRRLRGLEISTVRRTIGRYRQ